MIRTTVFIVLLSTILFLNNAEGRLHAEGIVGGDPALTGQFKYMVSIQAGGNHICGGGIIHDRFVVSAAHCFINYKGEFVTPEFTVIAGAIDLKNPGKDVVKRLVEKIYVPKEYSPFNPNPSVRFYRPSADIAILKLTEGFGLSSNSQLSKLKFPLKSSPPQYLNEPVIVTGFGVNVVRSTTENPTSHKLEIIGDSFDKLKFAKAHVVKSKKCSDSYKIPLYRSHICAQVVQRNAASPEGVCSGDSGSPLVHQGSTVIGVLASSSAFCVENVYPGEYTRVSSFFSFIEAAMKDEKSYEIRTASYHTEKKFLGLSKTRVLKEDH